MAPKLCLLWKPWCIRLSKNLGVTLRGNTRLPPADRTQVSITQALIAIHISHNPYILFGRNICKYFNSHLKIRILSKIQPQDNYVLLNILWFTLSFGVITSILKAEWRSSWGRSSGFLNSSYKAGKFPASHTFRPLPASTGTMPWLSVWKRLSTCTATSKVGTMGTAGVWLAVPRPLAWLHPWTFISNMR